MKDGPNIAQVAALIGDPARANMLGALMSGQALTVTELANEAGVQVQTASGHLSRMFHAGLLIERKQGRHKYFSLANEEVAHAIEALMNVAAKIGHMRTRAGPKDAAMRHARICYNHLAGDMALALFDAFMAAGFFEKSDDGLILSLAGRAFVADIGIDVDALEKSRSPLCKECLDWSGRRSHLAGSLGRAIMAQILSLGWARRDKNSRIIIFTPKGKVAFDQWLKSAAPNLAAE